MKVARNTTLIADWQRLVLEDVLPLEAALGLISTSVARVLGLHASKGRLAVGFEADVVLLDSELQPQLTFVAGKKIYDVRRL